MLRMVRMLVYRRSTVTDKGLNILIFLFETSRTVVSEWWGALGICCVCEGAVHSSTSKGVYYQCGW